MADDERHQAAVHLLEAQQRGARPFRELGGQRVEVLGREEIEEKMLMTPGDITMMLNETSGLRVQSTSPSLVSLRMRMLRRPAFEAFPTWRSATATVSGAVQTGWSVGVSASKRLPMRCARNALATSLESSEDQRFVVMIRSRGTQWA